MSSEFVVAGSNRPVRLETIDQALYAIALPVGGAVEVALLGFVRAPRDDRPDTPLGQVPTHRRAAVALVPGRCAGGANADVPARIGGSLQSPARSARASARGARRRSTRRRPACPVPRHGRGVSWRNHHDCAQALGLPPFRPCRVRVGSHHAPIHEVAVPIDVAVRIFLGLERRQDALPDALVVPTSEAAVHRLPLPVSRGQIAPGCSGPQPPANPVDDPPMVVVGTAHRGLLGR